jgi:hypothetical protein
MQVGSAMLMLALFALGNGCDGSSSNTADSESSSGSGQDTNGTATLDTETTSQANDDTVDKGTATSPTQETWIDEAHGVEWQNPSREQTSFYPGAKGYCDDLVLAGKDDWRLPTVDEARTLLEGVSPTMEGGFCAASEECINWMNCSANAKYEAACKGCSDVSGKHLTPQDCTRDIEAGECYWKEGLEGECQSYWTTTKTGVPTGRYSVNYAVGFVQAVVESSSGKNARCVRAL